MTDNRRGIYLGIPTYNDQIFTGTCRATWHATKRFRLALAFQNSSLLTRAFNNLWCHALNHRALGFDYFVMLHADLHPTAESWCDILVEEMERVGSDFMGVVSPIKNELGLTSTAIGGSTRWINERRLTMKEVMSLPSTFSIKDVNTSSKYLLINSGCMCIDLRAPWVEKILFNIQDMLWRDENGHFDCITASEDWLFSRDAIDNGAVVYATRKIPLIHHGINTWNNQEEWGTWEYDEDKDILQSKITLEELP